MDITTLPFSVFTQPVASLSHLLAALIACFFIPSLLRKGRGNKKRLISLIIFCAATLILFSMSGLYHSMPVGKAREVFHRIDYAAIWIMIAGSSTPIHVIMLRGFWRWGMLSIIWVTAVACLVVMTVLFSRISYGTSVSLYMGLSWLGTISGVRIVLCYGFKTLIPLLVGGFFYSAGAILDTFDVPDLITGVVGTHELFHFCVIAGAASHWYFIHRWAGHSTTSPVFPIMNLRQLIGLR